MIRTATTLTAADQAALRTAPAEDYRSYGDIDAALYAASGRVVVEGADIRVGGLPVEYQADLAALRGQVVRLVGLLPAGQPSFRVEALAYEIA